MKSQAPDARRLPHAGLMPWINERLVNPVQRLWAPWLPPWALVLHTGRRSGAARRTPVLAFGSGSTLAVILFYGSRTQWIRNLEAGGGAVVRAGRRREIAGLGVVRGPHASLPVVARLAARRLPVLVLELDQRA
jgi:deazaflavin-dependent oxidoreductase (nitroreductase family)